MTEIISINTKKHMKQILTILILITFPILLFAEDKPKVTATDLLQMQESQAFNAIGKA
jgi:hypothetical protein